MEATPRWAQYRDHEFHRWSMQTVSFAHLACLLTEIWMVIKVGHAILLFPMEFAL